MGKSKVRLTQKDKREFALIARTTPRILPFDDASPAAGATRAKKALDNSWAGFSFFCKTYFPNVFTLPFGQFHQSMFQAAHAATGICAITGFRNSGKTVIMGFAYPIWCLLRGHKFIIYVCANDGLARRRTRLIRVQFGKNARILHDFPDITLLSGADDELLFSNGAAIMASSVGTDIRGIFNPDTASRPDLVIGDDIDREQNRGSHGVGKKRLIYMISTVKGALAEDATHGVQGKVLWFGNLVSPNYAICQFQQSIIDDIRAQNPGWEDDFVSHLNGHGKAMLRFPLEDAAGKSIWPEKYPDSRLAELRAEQGEVAYLQEFLGRPVVEGNIFKYEWIKYYKSLPANIKEVWMYADPAWGEKGCYKAIIAAAWDGFSFYVLKVFVRQGPNTVFFRAFYDIFAELRAAYSYKFSAAMETSYGQARMIAELDRWCAENGRQPIGFHIRHINNQENKNARIESLEPVLSYGKVFFPDGQDMPTLVAQLLVYPDGYNDGPDALQGCLARFAAFSPTGSGARLTIINF